MTIETILIGLVMIFVLPWLVYVCVKLAVCGYYKGKELSENQRETKEDG